MSEIEARAGRGAGRRTGRFAGRPPSRGRVSPAAMSRIGLVLAVAAAVWFTDGGLRGALCGAALLGAVVVTDLIAERLRNGHRDRLDVWLSLMLGRLREYVVYAGLAIGGTAAGLVDAWAWAAGALIALALRDSAAAARQARVGEPEWTPESGLDRPIDSVDPSRHLSDGGPGDPSLTAELLGEPDPGGERGGETRDGAGGRLAARLSGGAGLPLDIRTVPRGSAWPGWETGRAEALGSGNPGDTESSAHPAAPEPRDGAADEDRAAVADTAAADRGEAAPADGDPAGTGHPRHTARPARVPGKLLRAFPLTRLAAFPQAARFGVVALTITIWDARVTFIALIVGCALAITGELVGSPARDTAR